MMMAMIAATAWRWKEGRVESSRGKADGNDDGDGDGDDGGNGGKKVGGGGEDGGGCAVTAG